MICPRCNIELDKGICLKCGYMDNGEQIEQFKKESKYDNIRIYNEEFDEMNTNQKRYLNLILGPLYFSYRNHLLIGTIISIISLVILKLELKLTNYLLNIGSLCTLLAFFNATFYIFINRVLYMSFSNVICIKLDNIKIKIKKLNKNYIEKLVRHKSKSILSLILQIIIIIEIIMIFIVKK